MAFSRKEQTETRAGGRGPQELTDCREKGVPEPRGRAYESVDKSLLRTHHTPDTAGWGDGKTQDIGCEEQALPVQLGATWFPHEDTGEGHRPPYV